LGAGRGIKGLKTKNWKKREMAPGKEAKKNKQIGHRVSDQRRKKKMEAAVAAITERGEEKRSLCRGEGRMGKEKPTRVREEKDCDEPLII